MHAANIPDSVMMEHSPQTHLLYKRTEAVPVLCRRTDGAHERMRVGIRRLLLTGHYPHRDSHPQNDNNNREGGNSYPSKYQTSDLTTAVRTTVHRRRPFQSES
jgi:hypothetical protein